MNPKTIFDLVESPKNETIFDFIEEMPPQYKEAVKSTPEVTNKSKLDIAKDYGKTIIKGGVEGLSRLANVINPEVEHVKGKGFVSTQDKREPKLEQELNELLPTDEGFVQKALRRGLRETPTSLAFPGAKIANIPRSIVAGFAGESAKELGGNENIQAAAELTAYLGPDVTKKLLALGKNKSIIEHARKLGISDEALTPLLQSETKQKWLSKLIPRGESTQKALKQSKNEIGNAYQTIQKSPEAAKKIDPNSADKFIKSITEQLDEMPRAVRKKIEGDLGDLLGKDITGDKLIDFYKKVNYNLSSDTKQLANLKNPIKEAIKSISPETAKDFEFINELHSKYYPIASRLKPTIADQVINAAESIGLFGSAITGYYPGLVHILGEKAARKLAKEMILNPRLQQLSSKTIDAMNANKPLVLYKLKNIIKDELKMVSPEASKELESLSEEEIREFLSHSRKEDKKTK